MTGLLILAGLVLLLILALAPAHRRASLPWRPGLDTRNDRDLARLRDDLSFAGPGAAQQAPPPPAGDAGQDAPPTSLAA